VVGDYASPVGLYYLRHNLVQLWLRYGIQPQTQQPV
jgi:hypothetical protein